LRLGPSRLSRALGADPLRPERTERLPTTGSPAGQGLKATLSTVGCFGCGTLWMQETNFSLFASHSNACVWITRASGSQVCVTQFVLCSTFLPWAGVASVIAADDLRLAPAPSPSSSVTGTARASWQAVARRKHARLQAAHLRRRQTQARTSRRSMWSRTSPKTCARSGATLSKSG
jgi:hypothetical protein